MLLDGVRDQKLGLVVVAEDGCFVVGSWSVVKDDDLDLGSIHPAHVEVCCQSAYHCQACDAGEDLRQVTVSVRQGTEGEVKVSWCGKDDDADLVLVGTRDAGTGDLLGKGDGVVLFGQHEVDVR